jgi:hypothetical protein
LIRTVQQISRPISFYFLETSPGHAFCTSNDSQVPITDLVPDIVAYNKLSKKYENEKLSKFKSAIRKLYECLYVFIYFYTKAWGWWNYTRHDNFLKKIFVEELEGVVVPVCIFGIYKWICW